MTASISGRHTPATRPARGRRRGRRRGPNSPPPAEGAPGSPGAAPEGQCPEIPAARQCCRERQGGRCPIVGVPEEPGKPADTSYGERRGETPIMERVTPIEGAEGLVYECQAE